MDIINVSKNVKTIFEIIFHLMDDLLLGIATVKDELYSLSSDSDTDNENDQDSDGTDETLY